MKKKIILLLVLLPFLLSANNNHSNKVTRIDNKIYRGSSHGEPVVNINSVTVTEQDHIARLTVSLSHQSNEPVTIHYKTKDGTATHPEDYRKENGWLTIPAGKLSATISISIVEDNIPEPTEYFEVALHLGQHAHATIGDGTGRITIIGSTTSYIELNNLMVVYKSTNSGTLPADYAQRLTPALEKLNLFYWRNSHMGIKMKWTVFEIPEHLYRVHDNGYMYPGEVDSDLRSRGFTNDTYDVVATMAANAGIHSTGVNQVLGKAGFCGNGFGNSWDMSYNLTQMLHEIIDSMFAHSGHTEYPSNSPGMARFRGEYAPSSGFRWDLNAKILRYWKRPLWLELRKHGVWGTIQSSVDNDLDTIPDNDPDVPLDEARLGSNPFKKDSDGDGLSDLQEAMAGHFTSADPRYWDSDHDGISDGQDAEPLYPLKTTIPFEPTANLAQEITEWPLAGPYFLKNTGDDSSSLYLAYSDQLLIGIKIPDEPINFRVYIDANNDGFYFGSDNIILDIDRYGVSAWLMDANADTSRYLGGINSIQLPTFGGSVRYETESNWHSYQIAIPSNPELGLNFSSGKKVGIGFDLHDDSIVVPEPDDLVTFTLAPRKNTTSYIELHNLVVVYRHTNGGNISDTSLLSPALEEARMFYWRHSHMGLNIKWTIYVVDDYLDLITGNGYVFPQTIDTDLRGRGFETGSYDAVVAVMRGSGAYAWGANNILGRGCYFQVPWWEEHYLFSSFFMHEFHHIVDAMFYYSGHPEYPSNHPAAARAAGEYVPEQTGETWDLNAAILRHWPRQLWLDLRRNGNWGIIKSAIDKDLDTIPDNDSDVPLDEKKFGSNPHRQDSDNDGMSDLQEAMAGIFTTANPRKQDSDGDGIRDGNDSEPIYPLKTLVPANAGLTLTQPVPDWPLAGHYFFNKPDAALSSLFLGYSANQLCIAIKIPSGLRSVRIVVDANNDGLFYGKDNIDIVMNGNAFESVKLIDMVSIQPNDTTYTIPQTGFSCASKSGAGWSSYQVIIPALPQYGLNLTSGQRIGIYIELASYGTLLEIDDFISVTLGDDSQCDLKTLASEVVPAVEEIKTGTTKLTAVAFPNPSSQSFTLQWAGNNLPLSITISDAMGRLTEKRTGSAVGGVMQIGNNWKAGIYYAEIVQGKEKVVLKLIKQ